MPKLLTAAEANAQYEASLPVGSFKLSREAAGVRWQPPEPYEMEAQATSMLGAPVEDVEKGTPLTSTAWKGWVRGCQNLSAAVGGGIPRIFGAALGIESMEEWGKRFGEGQEKLAEKYAPPPEAITSGDIRQDLINPSWWVSGLFEQLPLISATVGVGVGAGVAARLAGAGAKAAHFVGVSAGAGLGSHLEAVDIYDQSLAKGNSQGQALRDYAKMAGGVAALEAIPLHFILKKLPPGLKAKAANVIFAATTDTAGEMLEELWAGEILEEPYKESVDRALQVAGPAFVLSAMFAGMGAVDLSAARKEVVPGVVEDAEVRARADAETERILGVPPIAEVGEVVEEAEVLEVEEEVVAEEEVIPVEPVEEPITPRARTYVEGMGEIPIAPTIGVREGVSLEAVVDERYQQRVKEEISTAREVGVTADLTGRFRRNLFLARKYQKENNQAGVDAALSRLASLDAVVGKQKRYIELANEARNLFRQIKEEGKILYQKTSPISPIRAAQNTVGKFRSTLKGTGLKVNFDLISDKDIKGVVSGATSVQHAAATVFNDLGLGKVTIIDETDGSFSAALESTNTEDLETNLVASKVWTNIEMAIESAAIAAAGEQYVNDATKDTWENIWGAYEQGEQGRWARDFRDAVKDVRDDPANPLSENVEFSDAQIDKIVFTLFTRGEAWASVNPLERTSQQYFEQRIKPILTYLETADPTKGGQASWINLVGKTAQISFTQHATAATFFHELAHVWQRDLVDLPGNAQSVVARFLNERAKTDPEWLNSPEYSKVGPVESLGEGNWNWSGFGSEAFVNMSQSIHETLAQKAVKPAWMPRVVFKAFQQIGTWLGQITSWSHKYAPGVRDVGVTDAYMKLFAPTVKSTATAKMIETRIVSKSGVFRINPFYFATTPELRPSFILFSETAPEKVTTNMEEERARGIRHAEEDPEWFEATMLKIRDGGLLTAEEQAVGEVALYSDLQKHAAELLTIQRDGDFNKNARALTFRYRREGAVIPGIEAGRSRLGLALRALQQKSAPTLFFEAIANCKKEMTKNDFHTVAQMSQRIVNGEYVASVEMLEFAEKIKQGETPHLGDYIQQIVYNGMLSGPSLHLNNTLCNTLWCSFQVPHRGLSGAVDAVYSNLTGKHREVFFSEMIPLLGGMRDGLRIGWKAIKGREGILMTGDVPEGFPMARKLDVNIHKIQALEHSSSAFARRLGKWISFPGRTLFAMDVLFAVTGWQGQRAALKYRKGKLTEMYGSEAVEAQRMTDEWIEKTSQQFGRYVTFTDRLGVAGQGVLQVKRGLGPFGPFTIPFVRTLANITKRGAEMTPGIGVLAHHVNRANYRSDVKNVKKKAQEQADKVTDGDRESELWQAAYNKAVEASGDPALFYLEGLPGMVAKQIEGLILAAALLAMFDREDLTGDWPDTPGERDRWRRRGIIPNAARVNLPGIGPQWIQFSRLEPFGLPFHVVSSAYQRIKDYDAAKASEEETILVSDIFEQLTLDVRIGLIENNWLNGVSRLLDKEGFKPRKWLGSRIGLLVPYSSAIRTVAGEVDEYKNKGVRVSRELEGVLGGFLSVVPLPPLIWDQPQRLHIWGEVVDLSAQRFPRNFLPLRIAPVDQDTFEDELERIGMEPGLPGKTLMVEGRTREIPLELYQNYVIISGVRVKEDLTSIIESASYQRLPLTYEGDKKRKDKLESKSQKVWTRYREKVRREMRKLVKSGELQ